MSMPLAPQFALIEADSRGEHSAQHACAPERAFLRKKTYAR